MILIKRPRMMVVLSEEDVLSMLKRCPDVWETALRRGKQHVRAERAMQRKGKHNAAEGKCC